MKTCVHCGATNPDAANFCLDCGKAIHSSSMQQNQIPQTVMPQSRMAPDQSNSTIIDVPQSNSTIIDVPNQDQQVPHQGQVPKQAPAPTLIPQSRKPQVPDTIAAPSNATIPDAKSPNYVDPQQFQALYQKVIQNQRKADILFVLDCTGSMQGEIDAVRDAITSFADTIQSQSVRARVGLIEFRDRLIGEEQRVLLFEGEPFTSNPTLFREQVGKLRASGGGDEPESSLDAVLLALDQPFDPTANKVIVLVTDAPPHLPDVTVQSIDQVVQKMREITVDQFYVVMKTSDQRSQVYLRLLEGRRGLAFEIGSGDDFRTRAEDFKRTLMALGKTISTATR
ncbi:hypothetical protein LEP3755_37410 [Leptolyngbya sp. NIES-3755]|nr:hypothetical protein LEP3755_37410 [Leptolyngbya sp. NIES-3755]